MWAHQPSPESSQQLYRVLKIMVAIAKITTAFSSSSSCCCSCCYLIAEYRLLGVFAALPAGPSSLWVVSKSQWQWKRQHVWDPAQKRSTDYHVLTSHNASHSANNYSSHGPRGLAITCQYIIIVIIYSSNKMFTSTTANNMSMESTFSNNRLYKHLQNKRLVIINVL